MSDPDEPAEPAESAESDGGDQAAPKAAPASGEESKAKPAAKAEAKPAPEPAATPAEKAAVALAAVVPEPPPPIVVFLEKVDRLLGNLELGLLVFLVAVLIFSASYQAYEFRFKNQTPEWSNEVIRFSVFFIAMAGATLASHSRKLLAMDVLTRFLSPRKRTVVRVLTGLFTIFICLALAWGGLAVRDSVAGEEGIVLSPHKSVLAIPIGACVMALHMLIHLICDSAYLARGMAPPEDESMPLH